ncbi:hypothetical protein [Halosimplex sp. J119]
MDRLSSCYFCGAALDATLEERPVVPSPLHPSTDSQKTIVLCGTCQRKLDAVLDTVLDAVEAANVDPGPGSESQSGDPLAADDDLESALGDDEDILTSVGNDDAGEAVDASDTGSTAGTGTEASDVAAESDDSDDEDAEDGPKESKYTRSRGAGFRREEDGPVETGSLTGGAFSDDDDEDDSDAGSLTGDAFDEDSDESSDSGNRSASAGQSGASGGRSAADSGSGSSGGSDSSPSGEASSQRDVSMTRLENTKVMRLLENREFPVDRDEFVTVAANAYQVSRDDCDKVIDLAVEHDLLREENGQLYGGDA